MRGLRNAIRIFIQQRKASDYAIRMGFKPKDPNKDKYISSSLSLREKLEVVFCFSISAFMVYDVMRDRRLHYEAFMNNKDSEVYFAYDYRRPKDYSVYQSYPNIKPRENN